MVQKSIKHFPIPLRKSLKVIAEGDFIDMPKKGLSLIEILVAAIILALVMTGLANTFIAAKRHILHSRLRMTAAELGKYFLEPLQMQVRQDEWGTANCLSQANCLDETAGPAEGLDRDYTAHYTITPDRPISNLNRVRVDITWTELP